MFDLKTIVAVLFFNALMQSVVWTLMWLSLRRFAALKFVAGGLLLVAIGLFLFMQRETPPEPWRVILDNLLIKAGLLMLADALARFLGQPRYPRLALAWFGLHAVIWSAAIILTPSDLGPRVLSAVIYTSVVMLFMCATLMRDRSQPRALRWITIGILVEYIVAITGVYVMAETLRFRDTAETAVLTNGDGWFFLQANLFLMGYFGCMLFMVSNRLAVDLRMQNHALAQEVQRRRELEAELSASLEAETALRKDQEQFIRMVGHEFRTPLAIIKRATEMTGLMLPDPPAGVTERLGWIDDAVSRLITLIDRFLVIDSRDGGVLQIEDIDINAMLEDVDRHFEALGMAPRLRVEPYPGTLIYRGDPDMLLTVMINLVDNALKYSPPDSVVDVRVSRDAAAVLLMVTDTGIGIPEEEKGRIGSRFYRASNTRAATGTGLGLYNSRRLLAYHDGTLTLARRRDAPGDDPGNDPGDGCRDGGGGTVATVRLPLPGPNAAMDSARKVDAP